MHGIVLIVEGWSDHDQVQLAYPDIETIVIYGTRFDNVAIDKVKLAKAQGKIPYIMTDPDRTGDWVARRISQIFPDIKRISVDPDQSKMLGRKGWHYGVEYCSVPYLRCVLAPYIKGEPFEGIGLFKYNLVSKGDYLNDSNSGDGGER